MTLKQAAAVFNTQVFTNLSGTVEFRAQVTPFNDVTRSSEVSRRRIMEIAPEIVAPEVVIMQSTGEEFIVSTPVVDVFNGEPIRKKHVLNPIYAEYSYANPLTILSLLPASVHKGSIHYVKRVIITDRSEYFGGYSIVFPTSITPLAGAIIWAGSDYFFALEDSHIDDIGFSVTNCMKLTSPVQDLTLVNKSAYNPITETYTSVPTTNVKCIVIPREKDFFNSREDADKNLDGDVTITTLHPCAAGDQVGVYMVISVSIEGALNHLHCRLP